MAELFKETDDIIRLGKWAYLKIPGGERCGRCLILRKEGPDGFGRVGWYCDLRPAIALIHDEGGPFKDDRCPRKEA